MTSGNTSSSLRRVTPDESALDLDLLAASLRAESSDLNAFVESLAAKLEQAVPGRVKVYRWRTRLFGPKPVRQIVVNLGERRLELKAADGAIETSAARVSGGIVLKTETVDIETWVEALGQALAAEASRSEVTRKALERLLIQ
jgi:hypothetical protein